MHLIFKLQIKQKKNKTTENIKPTCQSNSKLLLSHVAHICLFYLPCSMTEFDPWPDVISCQQQKKKSKQSWLPRKSQCDFSCVMALNTDQSSLACKAFSFSLHPVYNLMTALVRKCFG